MLKIKNYTQEEYNLILNQLMVLFAFTFPIKHYANSTIFFLILIVFFLRRNFTENIKKIFQSKIVIVFLAFVIMHYIWFIGTQNMDQALILANKVKYGLYILIFVTFVQKEYYSKIIFAFLLSIFVSEIFSYLIFFNIIPETLYFYNEVVWFTHHSGNPSPFVNHMWYSIFLAFAVGIILYNILTIEKLNFKKVLYIIFFLTISINMFLQSSRSGYIIYFFIIIFTLFYVYRLKFLKYLLPLLLVFSISIFYLYNNFNTFKTRIDMTTNSIGSIINNKDYTSSLGNRIGIYLYSIDVIKNNFWFGVGTGDGMDEIHKILTPKDKHLVILTTPHNEFLNAQLKFGVLGSIVLIYLFYLIFTFKQENDYLNFILKSSSFIIFLTMLPGDFFQNWMIIFWIIPLSLATLNVPKDFDTVNNHYTKQEIKFYIFVFIFSYISAFSKTVKLWGT